MNNFKPSSFCLMAVAALLGACNPNPPRVVVITATSPGVIVLEARPTSTTFTDGPPISGSTAPITDAIVATPTPPSAAVGNRPEQHIVRPGESLSIIAAQYSTTVEILVDLNTIANPDRIEVGQVIRLPNVNVVEAPDVIMLPDARFVRGPESIMFDTETFVAQQRGFIRTASDIVTTRTDNGAGFEETLTAAQVIDRVAQEFSVDPRLLITILEFRAGWVSRATLESDQIAFPIVSQLESRGLNRMGLYRQLAFTANELNRGYYGFKTRGLRTIDFADGTQVRLSERLNPATVGMMHFLSRNRTYAEWQTEMSTQRVMQIYRAMFGDPFLAGNEPVVPPGLAQPALQLPFASSEVWRYTGGPHGGWGSGSAWASLDFAPPDERLPGSTLCYISITPVRAVADGIIARSADGALMLDLDGDGDERTGWTIAYLHMANMVPVGTIVRAGDIVGYASCAGGFSTATHLHIGRRYNGEWLTADCSLCIESLRYDDFVMSGWRAESIHGQEYQGFLIRGQQRLVAAQGRRTTTNEISW